MFTRVFATVLLVASFAHGEPLRLGREVPLVPPDEDAAPYAQFQPEIASNGEIFLVVWSDERAGLSAESHVYASRVTRDGSLLDRHGILLAIGPGHNPKVAWSGSAFIVTNGHNAVAIDADGAIVNGPVHLSDRMLVVPDESSLACARDRCLLSWTDANDQSAHGFLLSASGELLVDDIPLNASGAVTTDGNRFVVVGRESRCQSQCSRLVAQFVDTGGASSSPIVLDGLLPRAAVATDGARWLVTSSDGSNTRATLFSSDFKSVLRSFDLGISAYWTGCDVGAAWNESRYLVVGRNGEAVLTSDGLLDGPVHPSSIRSFARLAFASGGTGLVVWNSGSAGEFPHGDVKGALVSAGREVGEPFLVSLSARAQSHLSVAEADGQSYVSWISDVGEDDDSSTFLARLGDGSVERLAPVKSLTSSVMDLVYRLPVVLQLHGGNLSATIVRPEGTIESSIDSSVWEPGLGRGAILSSGATAAFAYSKGEEAWAAILDGSGAVVQRIRIPNGAGTAVEDASVVSTNGGFAVAWLERRNCHMDCGSADARLRVARFDSSLQPDGSVVDFVPGETFAVGLTVATDGENVFAVWIDTYESKLHLARMDASGHVDVRSDPIGGEATRADVKHFGSRTYLAWQESRLQENSATLKIAAIDDSDFPDAPLESTEVMTMNNYDPEAFEPTLANVSGQIVIIYRRILTQPPFDGVPRFVVRKIDPARMRGVSR